MTKKELQFQIDAAFAKTDKTNDRLSKAELELNQRIDDLVKKQAERYRMLLDYLKVEEEEYAVIVKQLSNFPYVWGNFPSEAVKKIRLVPIKKGKKL